MAEPLPHASPLERFIRSPRAILGAAFVAVGALVSVYAFIDDGNDDLKTTMLEQFELLGRQDATANDDLNYRLGIHRGITIGIAVCGIDRRGDVDDIANLLKEGT